GRGGLAADFRAIENPVVRTVIEKNSISRGRVGNDTAAVENILIVGGIGPDGAHFIVRAIANLYVIEFRIDESIDLHPVHTGDCVALKVQILEVAPNRRVRRIVTELHDAARKGRSSLQFGASETEIRDSDSASMAVGKNAGIDDLRFDEIAAGRKVDR